MKNMSGLLCAMLVLASRPALSQQSDEEELALAYGDKATISIATGGKQALARAPAVASVITAHDIEAMGVTELEQVLESVPGLHVSMLTFSSSPIYSFRGIHQAFNPQVLMLVNGLPITTVFVGNRGLAWGGMPLANVARIEIMRGPGSALYGADAYAGVINVITKTAGDIKGTEMRALAGAFHTFDASIQHGGKVGGFDIALFLRAAGTDGQKGIIERDFQTTLDGLFGTRASLAPGRISASRKGLDLRADVARDGWRLRTAYQRRKVGMMAGLADSLDPYSRMPTTRLYVDLGYQREQLLPNWDAALTLGFYNIRETPGEPAYLLFPPGAFGGAFPAGAYGNPGHNERHNNLSATAFYTGFKEHRVRMGAGYRVEDLYAASETKNFTFVAVPGVGPVFMPLPGMIDATGNPDLVYMQPHKRRLAYLFAQDEWQLAKDWTLTTGLRHDHYSDFGSTTNPRLALVWDVSYNVVLKAMHGRAYRAPNFTELYNMNNPVNIGNPNVRPETIATNELALSWQATPALQGNLTLFRYRMDDILRQVANADPTTGTTAQNTGTQSGRGLELEGIWDASRNLRLSANASLQHSIDRLTSTDAGLAPRRHLYGRVEWRPAPQWQFGAMLNHVAGRLRQYGDLRPPIADYTLVDLTLNRDFSGGRWSLRGGVQNLFNTAAREPTFAPGNVPNDLPLPGRAVSIQLGLRL